MWFIVIVRVVWVLVEIDLSDIVLVEKCLIIVVVGLILLIGIGVYWLKWNLNRLCNVMCCWFWLLMIWVYFW